MRSKQLDLKKYDTDKITTGYLDLYDARLAGLVDQPVRMLELGILTGGSLRLWRDYFPQGEITGIDVRLPPNLDGEDRIRAFAGSQGDTAFLDDVAARVAPDGFDVIVDDASHVGALTRRSFWHLFDRHLKPGGVYAIEDWGTGYWGGWRDGAPVRQANGVQRATARLLQKMRLIPRVGPPSHGFGMVGFIKELVDECGAADVSVGSYARLKAGAAPTRRSRIAELIVKPSIVFAIKPGGTRADEQA